MNNFMSQYNAELNRIQQAYSSEMQNLQNSLNQYKTAQYNVPPTPMPVATTDANGVPINVQILALLGEIKGILSRIAPKEDKDPKVQADPEQKPKKKE